jgi:hypothetical protein
MKNILIVLFAITATFSFGQTDTLETECSPDRMEYAVQLASTADPNLLLQKPKFYEEVIDKYEIERVCLKNNRVVYRILIPAEDIDDAYIKYCYYRKTTYKDCFIVTFRNGNRIN